MHDRTNRHSWMLILVLVSLSGWLQPLDAMAQTYGGGGPNINQATQESAHGPKARIAVAKFLDKSGKGQAAGIGSGMADMLATSLFQTGRYIVLERQNLQDVLSEQDLGASGRIRPDTAAAIGQVEGAEILVTGTITEFEGAASGGEGGLGVSGQDVMGDKQSLANKLFGSVVGKLGGAFQSSHLAIDMRLVDTRTGRIVAAASVKGEANDISGLGSAAGSGLAGDLSGYAKTPMEKAIRLAIQEAVQFVVAQTPAQYYRAPQPVAAAQQWPQQPAAGGFPGQGMPSAQQVPIPGQAGFPGQQPGYPQAQGQGGFPQQGYPQGGQPGFPQQGVPQGQGGFPPPQGQPGFPQASQQGFPPQGQPSFPQQSGYPQPPQAQAGFPQQGYPQGGQPGFPQQGFPQPQGQPAFPQAQDYSQVPQVQQGFPQGSQPAYPQQGFPQASQQGYPQAGAPQQIPAQGFPQAAQPGMQSGFPGGQAPTAQAAPVPPPKPTFVAEPDKDCPYFSPMPNYQLRRSGSKDLEFTSFQFFDGTTMTAAEGRLWERTYELRKGAGPASNLQIRRNYANAMKSMGGMVLFDAACGQTKGCRGVTGDLMVGKAVRGGKALWLQIRPIYSFSGEASRYVLTVIETEAMKQEVTASDLLKRLNEQGRVALYINFDVDKATIRPDSEATIAEIVVLLRNTPALSVSIEGHTDNTGNSQHNKALSEQRAKAVTDAIAQQGIERNRLTSVGWGQDAPIADNATEEGRAKNRRVELVKK